jgi:hypothetical protein
MGTTRLEGDKMRSLLAGSVNPYGIVKDFEVGTVQGIVTINGKEELFEIEGLVLTAIPRVNGASARSVDRSGETVRTPPAGRGKLRLACVDGVSR